MLGCAEYGEHEASNPTPRYARDLRSVVFVGLYSYLLLGVKILQRTTPSDEYCDVHSKAGERCTACRHLIQCTWRKRSLVKS